MMGTRRQNVQKGELKMSKYYIVRIREQAEEFVKQSKVAVGWSDVDFTKFKGDGDGLAEAVRKCYYSDSDVSPYLLGRKRSEVKRFINIKKGDIVARKSYNKDIIFVVKKVINRKENKIALLKGLIERVEADSDIKDLELVDKNQVKKCMDRLNDKLKQKAIINKDYKIAILTQDRQNKEKIKTGKILHLDGDSCLDNKNSLLA